MKLIALPLIGLLGLQTLIAGMLTFYLIQDLWRRTGISWGDVGFYTFFGLVLMIVGGIRNAMRGKVGAISLAKKLDVMATQSGSTKVVAARQRGVN